MVMSGFILLMLLDLSNGVERYVKNIINFMIGDFEFFGSLINLIYL